MKKLSPMAILLAFAIILSACRHSEFVNLASFVQNYKVKDELEITDFIKEDGENSSAVYSSYITKNENTFLLKLLSDESSKIKECRLTISKFDKNASSKPITKSALNDFSAVCENIVYAFTYFEEAKTIIASLDFEKNYGSNNAEQTKEQGNYQYIFLSNEICCEFIIKSRWLSEIETTQKPENKNDFTLNTSLRTETVPLQ